MNHISQKLDNDQLFIVLKKIIKERYDEVLQDAQLFDSLMKDLLPEKTKEIYLLTCSVKENIPMEIQKLGFKSQIEPDFTILMNRLVDKYCIQTEYAEWIIGIWNLAFTKKDEEPTKNKNSDQKKTPEDKEIGKSDLSTQEIESILKEEIKSLTEKINMIESENKFTRKFLIKCTNAAIFIVFILFFSIYQISCFYLPSFISSDYFAFFFETFTVPIIVIFLTLFLTLIANIILLSIIVSYRNKAIKL